MKKSILPLLIVFVFVILLTVLVINIRMTRLSDDESIMLKPFRLAKPVLPSGNTSGNKELMSRQELIQMVDDALQAIDDNRIPEAEEKIRTVLVFSPDNIKALTILGRILYARDKFVDAEALFRRQLQYSPRNASVLNNLGAVLAKQERYEEAINYVTQAAELSPDAPEIIVNLAGVYALNGNNDKALKQFLAAYRLLGPAILKVSGDTCFDSIRNRREFKAVIAAATRELTVQPEKTAVKP